MRWLAHNYQPACTQISFWGDASWGWIWEMNLGGDTSGGGDIKIQG